MGKLLLTLLVPLLFFGNGRQQHAQDKKTIILKPGQVTDTLGHYATTQNRNDFFLKEGEGDSGVLWIQGIDTALAPDIVNVAVITPSIIAYSGSPVYGVPGIFLFDFGKKKVKCIVPATNLNSAYPDGTDYFEIDRIDLDTNEIFFWHVPDVDKADFAGDWKSGHEYKIEFDGTGLMKVQEK